MATFCKVNKGSNSYWMISFFDEQKRRKTISLSASKFNEKTAKGLFDSVERLIADRINNSKIVDKVAEAWINSACREIQEKLARVGLVEVTPAFTCEKLWDDFLKSHQREVKESTLETYEHAKRRFFDFFSKTEPIESLTKLIMLQWKETLRQTLAGATVAGTLKKTKAVFNWAVKSGLLEESPLKGIGCGSFVNRQNDRFITIEEYEQLLTACICQEWRVILASARIGGLRCPSEMLDLRWKDIDWENKCFYVRSRKTEHHEGKEGRTVPLFAGLRKELEELHRNRESDSEFVITRYRSPGTSLGTQFARIVRKAGMSPIKRPFDNMRMSRSNEIYRKRGSFKEQEWIGHSRQVRDDHYLMMDDSDYSEAEND